jgi:ribonucleotide reductase alpha subunit
MVERACEDLTGVSVSDVVMEAKLNFFNGMSSIDIHRSLTKAATSLITEHTPNYQYVAGRLLNYDMRKTAWGGMEPPRLYTHILKMIGEGLYTKDLIEFYTEAEWDKIDDLVDHDRDLKIPHIGIAEYMSKYSMRDRSLEELIPLETPQITYILIAALVCSDTKSIKDIKTYYNHISQYNISLPTPIMAGLRSQEKQFSSCVLIEADDSLDSMAASSHAIIKYISKRAGIGIGASAIRAEGSKVRNGEIKHTGVLPFYRLFESAVKSCSQGGVRGGAATLFALLWHLDVEDIISLKNNKGTPDTRVRKLDYCIQINNYLYKRLVEGKNITLFSPNDVEDLYDAFFADQEEFGRLYEQYEKDASIRKKSIPALELFTKLMIERKDTGRIYIMNVDNVNNSSPFSIPVKMSNLCLSGDTRISTSLGLKTLEELYETDASFSVSSDIRAIEDNLVLMRKNNRRKLKDNMFGVNTYNSSKVFLTNDSAEVYEIQTKSGHRVKGTLDHKIMTNVGMVEIRDLTPEHYIYVQSGSGVSNSSKTIDYVESTTESKVWTGRYKNLPITYPAKWSTELGELLGMLVGDGFITNGSVAISVGKDDYNEMERYVTNLLSMLVPSDRIHVQIHEGSKQIKISDQRAVHFLKHLGVTQNYSDTKKVPSKLWDASQDAQIGFLRGLFESDGTIDISKNCQAATISLTSTSRTLLDEVQILLSNLGIFSKVYKVKNREYSLLPDGKGGQREYKVLPAYTMKIGRSDRNKFLDTIKFISKRKNDKAVEYIRHTAIRGGTYQSKYFSSFVDIKYVGRMPVYDITVDHSHSFIANGIVVHNCVEIALPTTPFNNILDENGRIALCTLSAINIANLKSVDDLEDLMYWAVRSLDNILSYQNYPLIAAKKATDDFRPLGIGTINLAYYLAKNSVKYGDPQALSMLHEIYEAMEFYGLKASVRLAKERGKCLRYEDTKYAKGLLPIDWYNKNVDEVTPPVYKLDWEWLRNEIKLYGVRNATITAHMPAESSCKPANATNGVEPVRSLITVKGNKSNISKQVVPEISRLKNKYDLLWEMKSMDGIIKTMAVIQKFCSQSISTNLSYNPINYPDGDIPMSVLLVDLLKCNKYGLKTLYYHNTNDQRDVSMVADDVKSAAVEEVKEEPEICDSCVI